MEFRECRIYDVNRSTEVTPIASSFDEWLVWIDEHYRFEDEDEEEDTSEPEFQPVYKPNSPLAEPMNYVRESWPKSKEEPAKKDVKHWLAFNNNTARDLALSIRNEGHTDAFPVLADALEEAGCTNADLLNSCRTGDPDIDGVWVLQVLLGKA